MSKISFHSRTSFLLSFLIIFFVSFQISVYADVDSKEVEEIILQRGELETIEVYSLTRLSIEDPFVADVVKADDKEILIVAKGEGSTALFLWDEFGKRTIIINVLPKDLEQVKNRLETLFETVGINEVNMDINNKEGKVVVSGNIPKYKRADYDTITLPLADMLIDLVMDEEIADLIQIDMQVTELNTTLSKSLGIDWASDGAEDGGITLAYPEQFSELDLDGSIGDYFKIGDFKRSTSLIATVNALIQEGKARVLSKPKIVVKSGEEASFLVGGEIPVRTTTTSASGGTTQENVSYKTYGIGMSVSPTIVKDKIDITMNVEVSDIDASSIAGSDIAFVTRTASTQLYLDNNQTIMLAGLIRHNDSEVINRIPYLSNIPILGAIFRNKKNPAATLDQELVITLTPTILARNRNDYRTKSAGTSQGKGQPSTIIIKESYFGPAKNETKQQQYYTDLDLEDEYEGVPPEMISYVHDIQEKISDAIIYPREAMDYGWEGTVKLELLLTKDGSLAFALVKESSGHEVIDENALNIAKSNAPYSQFPSTTDLRELNVTIPVVYKLRRN